MAEEKQDGQKTIVAFVVGLLIGGMLVWAFSGPADDMDRHNDDSAKMEESGDAMVGGDKSESDSSEVAMPKLSVGDGKIAIENQAAGTSVSIGNATYPVSEGWIGVRDYTDGELGLILGVARFSEEQGLVPDAITLLRSTRAGKEYAVVIFTEDGDRKFNLAGDVQIDTVFDTFTAE